MSRGDFVEGLRAAFYGDSSPLPVPGYLLDAALGAVLSVILERGRAGLPTYWECVGAFYPYVRPGRNMEVSVRVPVATYPYFEYVKEVRVIPARRWLYFRSARVSAALRDFAINANFSAAYRSEYQSKYEGGEGGVYKPGRRAVWEAARAELSKVTKGREWGAFFVHGENGLVASPFFVNGFFARVAALMGRRDSLDSRGFGVVGAVSEYVKVTNPATGKALWVLVPTGFFFERMRSGSLGVVGGDSGAG